MSALCLNFLAKCSKRSSLISSARSHSSKPFSLKNVKNVKNVGCNCRFWQLMAWVMCRTLIADFPMPSGCQWWAFLHLGCTRVCLTASAWSEGCCSWSPTWPFVRRGEVCACDGTPGIPANVTILGNNESNGFVFYRRFFKIFFQYLQLLLDCDEGVSGLSWLQPGQRPPDPFQQLKKTSRKVSWKHSKIWGVINWGIELSLSRCTNNLKIQLLMHWRCRKALGKLSSHQSRLFSIIHTWGSNWVDNGLDPDI